VRGETVWKVVLGGYFATLARRRRPYPTDLSEAQWNHIESHLPAANGYGRPRAHSLRERSSTPSSTSLKADASGGCFPTTAQLTYQRRKAIGTYEDVYNIFETPDGTQRQELVSVAVKLG
jgi:hypothetical protein